MTITTYRPEKMFDGEAFYLQPFISVKDGVIIDIQTQGANHLGPIIELDGVLVPGFIDVQVNGGGGVLFNNAPQPESLLQMIKAHSRYGTTALLATLITDDISVMQAAADAVAYARKKQFPGILGIHFEGPHLSVAKKGVHPANLIRPISTAEWQLFERTDLGIKKITVAPENICPRDILKLTELGWVVSLGHSNATAEQVNAALAAGATGFTHLFNAMSPLTSREPGMVGAALEAEAAYCGIILDNHHVHRQSARLAWKLKGSAKLALVTDAMALVGSHQNSFELFSETITRQEDKLTTYTGQLAGSHLSMAQALNNAVNQFGIPFADALIMLSRTPAAWLKQSDYLGQIKIGRQADWVLLDKELNVRQTFIKNQPVEKLFT
ncbi:N-acetylglucosamine-6-phosphate deacetylase [Gayadomonas joobiniege]|uniref:N-acetylglucosamine-6-phosphate deacetylase n=1 Tax=Gayadomonas joobiniege TaxID=1234606 RepID=UPI000380FC76|nr:N-acetylglucosamine-6-phosphate deacetylase [Gayadomonas joobiniege]